MLAVPQSSCQRPSARADLLPSLRVHTATCHRLPGLKLCARYAHFDWVLQALQYYSVDASGVPQDCEASEVTFVHLCVEK